MFTKGSTSRKYSGIKKKYADNLVRSIMLRAGSNTRTLMEKAPPDCQFGSRLSL